MKPVVTAAEMRALDRATIEEIGIPGLTLMETAGRAIAAAAVRMLESEVRSPKSEVRSVPHIAVVCGPGNNGGDGYVVARVLREQGYDAVVYLAVARGKIAGDAAAHLAILEKCGGVVRAIDGAEALGELAPGSTSPAGA